MAAWHAVTELTRWETPALSWLMSNFNGNTRAYLLSSVSDSARTEDQLSSMPKIGLARVACLRNGTSIVSPTPAASRDISDEPIFDAIHGCQRAKVASSIPIHGCNTSYNSQTIDDQLTSL